MYTKYKQRWLENQTTTNESNDDTDDDEPDQDPLKKKGVIPLWKRLNKDGYTPLTLAAKLGELDMFSFLLEERKITQWSYGPVSCVLYPLDQVDLEFQDEASSMTLVSRYIISMCLSL
jgi:ankyrin repeat protein